MTQEQYDYFKKVIGNKGYKLRNAKGMVQNESFHFYKGFAYLNGEDKPAGYWIIFLVWDSRDKRTPDNYTWGVTPLILTDNHEWSRIDLTITDTNFDVEKVEEFAHDFYYKFLLTHGL